MINFIKSRWKLIIVILILPIVGFAVYSNFTSSTNKKIETSKVKKGILEETMTISGTIDADEKANLRFQTSGRLSWVGVKEGDYVKKYQTLASLDQREVKKNLQKDLNDYLTTRSTFDQTIKDDYRDKVITDPVKRLLDKAQWSLNNSVLDVEIQNLSLEYSYLWTPIEGIVTKVGAPYTGMNVTPATSEFEIINPKTVFFNANADQTEVTKLTEGKLGSLSLDAYPDATISGSIKSISFTPKSGETGTVYAVKFIFKEDNSSYKYRMGMGGDLTFVLKQKQDVLHLPIKYVKGENGKKYVKMSKNGKEEKIYVVTGMETDTSIEIISGLTEGDIVYD